MGYFGEEFSGYRIIKKDILRNRNSKWGYGIFRPKVNEIWDAEPPSS